MADFGISEVMMAAQAASSIGGLFADEKGIETMQQGVDLIQPTIDNSLQAAAQGAAAARANAAGRKGALDYEADQLAQNANQQIAAAQRTALDARRQAMLVQSRALAVAAAGGGGATDVSVVTNMGRIAGEGAYRSAVAIYDGEDRARVLRMQAEAKRYEGALALQSGEYTADAYRLKGEGDVLKARAQQLKGEADISRGQAGMLKDAVSFGTSLFDKYGGKTSAVTSKPWEVGDFPEFAFG